MSFRTIALGLTALAALGQPAHALTFNFTTKPGDTLTADETTAFSTAASVWSASLSDAITVNLQIGFTSLAANVLGQTTPTILYGSTAYIRSLLAADAKDTVDTAAVASLSTGTQTQLAVTSAEAKALGATIPVNTTSDGLIEFSTNFTFSTSRNADGSVAAGTYDLIGIAEHEIGHILGFVSSIDGGTSGAQTLLDQFRYSAANTRSVVSGAAAYFSVNNGMTNIAGFSNGVADQASHWAIGVNGVMVPEAATGQTQNITALDIEALDAIGYDAVVVAVPEPWSIGLLALGTLSAIGLRRRVTHPPSA